MKPIFHLVILIAGPCASAQETAPQLNFSHPGEATATYTVETVLQGLDHPCGLTIRPGGSQNIAAELYLAERGAGRILKMATDIPGVIKEVIVGLPTMDFKKSPISNSSDRTLSDEALPNGSLPGSPLTHEDLAGEGGPLGLLFLTHSKLVVYCHREIGNQFLNVYRLPTDHAVLTADQTDHRTGSGTPESVTTSDPTPGDHSSGDWPQGRGGCFCSLVMNSEALFVSSGGETQGRIWKTSLEANRLTNLRPFIPATLETPIDPAIQTGLAMSGPVSMAINPKPRFQYLTVGRMGHMDRPRDSHLAFYSSNSGRLAMNVTTGLHDLVGLSYTPEGTLYSIDLAWQVEADGGIYRLDDTLLAGKPSCRAMKIAPIHHPTSMVFAPDGSLYVTAWGPTSAKANAKSKQKSGVLLKITGEW